MLNSAIGNCDFLPIDATEGGPGCGPGTPGMKRQQGYNESMKAFLMREVLSDPDMVADLEAGRGAAHFNMDDYLVRQCSGWGPASAC